MENRVARFSAVWPIFKPIVESVRPLRIPIIGISIFGLNLNNWLSLFFISFDEENLANHLVASVENKSGECDSASVPPANTMSERPS